MKRIDNLIARAKRLVDSAPFKVFLRDGKNMNCSGGDVIPLLQRMEIEKIEHDESDTNNGLLPLLFADLIDGSGTKEQEE